MASLQNLTPHLVWKHFLALSRIPRGSKNERAAADFVVALARSLDLPVKQDAVGNVVVTKRGTRGLEDAPVMVLQGHLDMVCEKNEGHPHDFLKDPIDVTLDGDWVHANGTTLGADNGIGVAAALAVLESKDLAHPPLECLFTIDEETGLTGAFNLGSDALTGKRMLNLDTEEEGSVYIGCAGGLDSVATRRVARVAPHAGRGAYRIKIAGLKGGHSGLDIAEGRGNAIKVLARALRLLIPRFGLEVASFEGGSKRNAIPREAFAVVSAEPAQVGAVHEALAQLQADVRSELGPADPEVTVTLEAASPPATVIANDDTLRVAAFLHACPHGMLAMTPDIPGLVQTSTNLGVIVTKDDLVEVSLNHRSAIDSAKKDVGFMVMALCELAGFAVEQSVGYPGWKPNVASPLLAAAKQIHTELFGRPPAIKAVHAGLECGIIGEKYPGMDMISIGPTITGAHSPDERMHVPSVATFWTYVTTLLAKA